MNKYKCQTKCEPNYLTRRYFWQSFLTLAMTIQRLKTHWDTSHVFAPLCGNLQPLMQKQRLLHSNTNKRHTRSSSCWKPNCSEFVLVISDRLVAGTTSQWRLQPTGAPRKGKEAAEETGEESNLTLTAPFGFFTPTWVSMLQTLLLLGN